MTHIHDSQVPDNIVSKTSASRGDRSEARASIERFVQVIIPVLFTFTLQGKEYANYSLKSDMKLRGTAHVIH